MGVVGGGSMYTACARSTADHLGRCPGPLRRTSPRPLLNGVVEHKVRSCPGTRFVLEHLAAATTTSSDPADLTAYTAAVESIAKLPNVECIQLGGVASQWGSEGAIDKAAVGAYVKAAINAFGFSRVCFEGNWFFNNCMFICDVLDYSGRRGCPLPTWLRA